MGFYQKLSEFYDEIFPAAEEDLAFLKKSLAGRRNLLDVGCGSGNKTELLAEEGRSIIGLDLDPAMVDLARARHQRPGIDYRVGDMVALDGLFPRQSFDGLLCLGNTLVHLTEPADLRAFFKAAAELLTPASPLIIQTLNYDLLYKQQVKELPPIFTGQLAFRRFYESRAGLPGQWTADDLVFHTVLEIRPEARGRAETAESVYEARVPLRPLFRAELEELLSRDFHAPDFYGGYDGRPAAADSLPLITIARRR